eukprot:TRINITY_DN3506_c0_g1_i1.p1 TRINITY_DN3506_c0_g1~~TRINITY_DN3506_c0_g1_i1.p1  ORF type:complete len:418 (+),score=84.98 TRINITY_DN3506_c0_g1_i1:29-1282(+)
MDRRAGATWCRKLMLVHVVLAATNASLLFLVHRQLSATTAMRESVETNLRDDTLVLAARLQGVEEREHHVFKREELLGAEERLVAERGQFYRRAVQDRDFLAGTFASARVRAVYDRQLAWIGDRRARCPGAVTGNATARDAVDAEITQLLSAAPRSCGGARFLQCPSPDELEQCGTVCALQQTLYCFFVAIAVGRVPLPDASLVCSDVKNGSCLVGRVPCAPPANASIPARQWNIQRETKGDRVLRLSAYDRSDTLLGGLVPWATTDLQVVANASLWLHPAYRKLPLPVKMAQQLYIGHLLRRLLVPYFVDQIDISDDIGTLAPLAHPFAAIVVTPNPPGSRRHLVDEYVVQVAEFYHNQSVPRPHRIYVCFGADVTAAQRSTFWRDTELRYSSFQWLTWAQVGARHNAAGLLAPHA